MSGFIKSSIAKKVAMALSGLFLVIFLAQHFFINFTSVFSADTFNEISHFMGTNSVVQYVAQPILIFGVLFHFIMGFVLEIQNRNARAVSYAKYNGGANASWMSRNMIYSGGFILIFLVIHFIDFWVPEINIKFIEGDMSGLDAAGNYRYYDHVVHAFEPLWRTALYVVGFVFLALHLLHGFQSSFQSVGFNNKYSKALKGCTTAYAIIIPLGFIFIALYHHLNQ
ncbi:MAG: succinate dehydrogenase cytochrome b subunit [Flavobacteriaceae bacterium]